MKGMNMIIVMGGISIFIAAFFILFSFDKMVSANLNCIIGGGDCTGQMVAVSSFGLFIIFALAVMIAAALYIMFISFKEEMRYKGKHEGVKAKSAMKGTNTMLLFGIVIFLIASFFSFFVFDKLVSNELVCLIQHGAQCRYQMSEVFVFGSFIMIAMIVMIVLAVYIMIKNKALGLEYSGQK